MATPFLGEIRMFGFGFAPKGWAACDGQLLPINQNQAVFALLGTQYGGNGQTNFALPDLRARVPLHRGPTLPQGAQAGAEAVSLDLAQLPPHQHGLLGCADLANASAPGGALPAAKPRGGFNHYGPSGSSDVVMNTGSLALSGGNQPHPNQQPFAVLNFAIALAGIFPSRN